MDAVCLIPWNPWRAQLSLFCWAAVSPQRSTTRAKALPEPDLPGRDLDRRCRAPDRDAGRAARHRGALTAGLGPAVGESPSPGQCTSRLAKRRSSAPPALQAPELSCPTALGREQGTKNWQTFPRAHGDFGDAPVRQSAPPPRSVKNRQTGSPSLPKHRVSAGFDDFSAIAAAAPCLRGGPCHPRAGTFFLGPFPEDHD
jgi:hypothetical protein